MSTPREAIAAIEAHAEGDLAGALAAAADLEQRYGPDAALLGLKAQLQLRRHAYIEAVISADAAAVLDPADHACRFLGALARYYLGHYAEALEHARASFSRRKAALTYHIAALCLLRLGRIEDAAKGFARLLDTFPTAAPAVRYNLLQCHRLRRRHSAANAEAVRLRADVAADLGRLYMLYGELAQQDFIGWAELRDKDSLARLLRAARRPFTRHPESFVLPEDGAALQSAMAATPAIWIVKPPNLFGGQGMRLVERYDEIGPEAGLLVQRYVADPYLIDGRKGHLRLYLLFLPGRSPATMLWCDGILRIAPTPYDLTAEGRGDMSRHITNTALHKGHPDLHLSARDGEGNVWSVGALMSYLARQGADPDAIWQRLRLLAADLAAAIGDSGLLARAAEQGPFMYPPKLIGLDVLLDSTLQPWLIETQRSPATNGGKAQAANRVNDRLMEVLANLYCLSLPVADGADGDDALALVADRAAAAGFIPVA